MVSSLYEVALLHMVAAVYYNTYRTDVVPVGTIIDRDERMESTFARLVRPQARSRLTRSTSHRPREMTPTPKAQAVRSVKRMDMRFGFGETFCFICDAQIFI